MLTLEQKICRAVAHTAELLDECSPVWAERLDRRTLDVREQKSHPLTQVCGSFSEAMVRLGTSHACVFRAAVGKSLREDRALNRAWQYEVQMRETAAA